MSCKQLEHCILQTSRVQVESSQAFLECQGDAKHQWGSPEASFFFFLSICGSEQNLGDWGKRS